MDGGAGYVGGWAGDDNMTPMGRSFYGENKRVSNARLQEAFGPMLYPTYREGLAGLLD